MVSKKSDALRIASARVSGDNKSTKTIINEEANPYTNFVLTLDSNFNFLTTFNGGMYLDGAD